MLASAKSFLVMGVITEVKNLDFEINANDLEHVTECHGGRFKRHLRIKAELRT